MVIVKQKKVLVTCIECGQEREVQYAKKLPVRCNPCHRSRVGKWSFKKKPGGPPESP